MSCTFHIITTIIAFAIHPVVGVLWVIAQIARAITNDDQQKSQLI